MRSLFGVVALLVGLAIVGVAAVKQMKGDVRSDAAALEGSQIQGLPDRQGNIGVSQHGRQLKGKVTDDLGKAMAQGAEQRREEAEAR
jgi:hypothetical protein